MFYKKIIRKTKLDLQSFVQFFILIIINSKTTIKRIYTYILYIINIYERHDNAYKFNIFIISLTEYITRYNATIIYNNI